MSVFVLKTGTFESHPHCVHGKLMLHKSTTYPLVCESLKVILKKTALQLNNFEIGKSL